MTLIRLLFFSSPLFLSGCSNYQYATVSSEMNKNERRAFFQENDSLKIVYNFYGENGPISIDIENKQAKPVYVDWKRSALIINGENINYWENRGSLNANQEGVEFNWTPTLTSTSSVLAGEWIGDNPTSFIAPASHLIVSKFRLVNTQYPLPKSNTDNKAKIQTKMGLASAFKHDYQRDSSPLRFRLFITVSNSPSFTDVSIYESEFWVSELLESSISPANYISQSMDQHRFYISSDESEGAGILLGIITLGILGALVAVE